MKKFKVVAAIACGLFFASCSSDDADSIVNNSGNIDTIRVAYIDANGNISQNGEVMNQVLCFGTEEQYCAFVEKVKSLSADEKNILFDELGFTNLKKMEKIADCELDSIGENCSSEVDFRNEYRKYVNRYAKALVTNKQDTLDLSLYVPASDDDDLYPYIVGANKLVVVNSQLHIINFLDDMNSLDKKVFATKSNVQEELVTEKGKGRRNGIGVAAINVRATGTNDVKCGKMDCSLKVHFSCDVKRTGDKTGKVMFHFGAQKKMWYGWKRTSREFYFTAKNMSIRTGKETLGVSIKTGRETLSDYNSYVEWIPGTDLYGLTCTNCRKEKRPKFCDIGSETFPVADFEIPYKSDGGSWHLRGKVTIFMMCHGEKFKEDEIWQKVHDYFFNNYPCVECNIDQEIAWR